MCSDVFNDPVVVCEGEHHLCRACMETLRRHHRHSRKCPECRRPFKIGAGQRFLKTMLDGLKVYCPNQARGCEATPKRGELRHHIEACPLTLVACLYCSEKMERRVMVRSHLHCDAARFGCEFVAGCEAGVAVHLVECAVAKCRAQFERYERQIAELKLSVVPPGALIPWAGRRSRLPAGWALCDGERGRPDRSGDFEVATSSSSGGRRKRRRLHDASDGGGADDVEYSLAYIIRQADAEAKRDLAEAIEVNGDDDEDSDEGGAEEEGEEEEEGDGDEEEDGGEEEDAWYLTR
mmetsp:Transcript_35361/g.94160  ORF Transcript_35361/g.94160 Transcript_35361/m.94160 type:complete len:293 (-) Transcript_35361:76-954(-)